MKQQFDYKGTDLEQKFDKEFGYLAPSVKMANCILAFGAVTGFLTLTASMYEIVSLHSQPYFWYPMFIALIVAHTLILSASGTPEFDELVRKRYQEFPALERQVAEKDAELG
jgi:hypothetical protein